MASLLFAPLDAAAFEGSAWATKKIARLVGANNNEIGGGRGHVRSQLLTTTTTPKCPASTQEWSEKFPARAGRGFGGQDNRGA